MRGFVNPVHLVNPVYTGFILPTYLAPSERHLFLAHIAPLELEKGYSNLANLA